MTDERQGWDNCHVRGWYGTVDRWVFGRYDFIQIVRSTKQANGSVKGCLGSNFRMCFDALVLAVVAFWDVEGEDSLIVQWHFGLEVGRSWADRANEANEREREAKRLPGKT